MNKNVVAYYRTSSQSNVGTDKDSLKRQKHSVENYTKSNGMVIIKDFYDKRGISYSSSETKDELLSRITIQSSANGEITSKHIKA